MHKIELKLLRSRKIILPFVMVFIVMSFIAFISFWIGNKQKAFEGDELASYVSTQVFHSKELAFFFLIWMIQHSVHLNKSGFYKCLLVFGWTRDKLYSYFLFQVGFNAFLFMLMNYICNSWLSFFYSINPIQLASQTNFFEISSQFLYFFLIGNFGIFIGSLYQNYVILLPVLIYWMLEFWISSFLKNKFELTIGEFLPLQSVHQLIGENYLSSVSILPIAVYSIIIFFGLSLHTQKRMFI